MQQNSFLLILKSKPYTLPTLFKHTFDMSPEIYNHMVFNSSHSYQVKSNATDQVFQSFLNYLINDEEPNVTLANYNQYLELSQEFRLLDKLLAAKKQFFGEYLINLNGLRQNDDHDVTEYELEIAKNLDKYLEKYGEYLIQSPIQSLYNIFNHEERVLTNHNLAYELIEKHFEATNNSDIFILIDLIDGTKLSKSNLSKAISLKSSRFNHIPSIDFNFIANAISKEEELQNQITSLLTDFTNFKKETEKMLRKIENEQKEQIKNIEEKHKDEIDGLKKLIKDNDVKINRSVNLDKEVNKKEMNSLIIKIDKNTNKISEVNNLLSTQIKNNENQNSQIVKNIQENKESYDQMIESVKNQIKENENIYNSKFSTMKQEQEKNSESLNKIINQNSKNINEIQQKLENILFVRPSLTDPGILCKLKKKEENAFDHLFIASINQSISIFM